MQKLGGFESNFLYNWQGWDELETLSPIFYEVTLKPGVFSSEVVQKFDGGDLWINFNKNQIVLQKDGEEAIFDIHATASIVW